MNIGYEEKRARFATRNSTMASTLLKFSLLLLCVAFVLSAPLEDEKQRVPRFLKRVGNFFKGIGRFLFVADKDRDRYLTFEEQAAKIILSQDITRETAQTLAEQGKHLKAFALTLEDLNRTEGITETLRTLSDQALDIADLTIKNSKAMMQALIDNLEDVEDVAKLSATELGLAMADVDKSIADAQKALKKVGTSSESTKGKSTSQELEETLDMILDATQSIANVGAYSAKFEEKAEKAGKDVAAVLARAADRIAQSAPVTG
ncbi:hypothetical protein PoB_004274000 [Plakobranchus ocellatus]|uniref:Uncharacterized protein n=1 Tax=Plakobranchus ocellatus TaxID=259542 RepID=A0AAV4B9N9_9GAST|nr:hypothetical protein PoB_004274000 [Plakobranchus ocellatus]